MRVYSHLNRTGYQFRQDKMGVHTKSCLRYLRETARKIGVKQSQVQFAPQPQTMFGMQVRSTLTMLPDPALGESFEFGSQPRPQKFLGHPAQMWEALRRRRYLDKSGLPQNKNHYVLAHLMNHNVGGSGEDPQNLVPLWASANTEMEREAEATLKQAVNDEGFTVQWQVDCNLPMGMTEERRSLLQKLLTNKGVNDISGLKGDDLVRYEILLYEQHLPQNLTIALSVTDHDGKVLNHPIPSIQNFVPMTIPELVP
jgi:hypothetical protein